MNVAWACRIPGLSASVPEGLVMLYSLSERAGLPSPIKYMPDMTHELMVFGLDPVTPIDFTRSIWEQKELKPLQPASVGFQFEATSEANAANRVQSFMDKVRTNEAVVNVFQEWQPYFPEAIDIVSPIIEPNDPAMDLSIMADHDELYVSETQSTPRIAVRASIATWANARRFRDAAAWTLGFAAVTTMLTGSIMPALDFAESLGIPVPGTATVTRTLEFDGGRKMVVKLTRKFGASDHYVAELISVEAPDPKSKVQDISY